MAPEPSRTEADTHMNDNTNPYQMPEAAVAAPSDVPQSQPVKAIMVGFAIVWVGRKLPSIFLSLMVSPDWNHAERMQFLTMYSTLTGISHVLFGFIAGYVCATLSRRNEFRHALMLGGLAAAYTLLGSLSLYSIGGGLSYLSLLPGILLTVVLILLGSWLGRWRNLRLAKRRSASIADDTA